MPCHWPLILRMRGWYNHVTRQFQAKTHNIKLQYIRNWKPNWVEIWGPSWQYPPRYLHLHFVGGLQLPWENSIWLTAVILKNEYDVITTSWMVRFGRNFLDISWMTCRWLRKRENRNWKWNSNMAAVSFRKPEVVIISFVDWDVSPKFGVELPRRGRDHGKSMWRHNFTGFMRFGWNLVVRGCWTCTLKMPKWPQTCPQNSKY